MDVLRVTQRLQDRLKLAEIGKFDEFIQRGDHESRSVVDAKPAQRVCHVINKSGHDTSMISP